MTRSVATDQGGGILNRGTITVAADAQLSVGNDGSGDDAMTGGGILMDGGAITVDGQLWVDNNASMLDGGGVAVTGGTLSTGPDGEIQVRKNRSGRDGGGIAVSAGLVTGRLLVEANAAAGVGGGLAAVGGPANFGLVDSAVVANVAAEGGGVGVVAGTVVMLNSTVAGNTATLGWRRRAVQAGRRHRAASCHGGRQHPRRHLLQRPAPGAAACPHGPQRRDRVQHGGAGR